MRPTAQSSSASASQPKARQPLPSFSQFEQKTQSYVDDDWIIRGTDSLTISNIIAPTSSIPIQPREPSQSGPAKRSYDVMQRSAAAGSSSSSNRGQSVHGRESAVKWGVAAGEGQRGSHGTSQSEHPKEDSPGRETAYRDPRARRPPRTGPEY